MIPVTPAPEPAAFDKKVRQPGLCAIAELAGEQPDPPRTAGQPCKKVATSRDEIPPDKFPTYWRKMLGDLLDSYHRICAYSCLYISRGTGARSVDHAIAKSRRWDQVYEWSNYRLACSQMNARKGAVADVLDPFEIGEGWFALELVEFQVLPGDGLSDEVTGAVANTIERLRLNDHEFCKARAKYAEDYLSGDVSFCYLTRHAPFVAGELQRQRWLLPRELRRRIWWGSLLHKLTNIRCCWCARG